MPQIRRTGNASASSQDMGSASVDFESLIHRLSQEERESATPSRQQQQQQQLRRLHHGELAGSQYIHKQEDIRSEKEDEDDDTDDDDNEDDPTQQPNPASVVRGRRKRRTLKRISTLSKAFTAQEETTVIRKLDRNLVLFLSLLYLLSFLDRSNIGNARIAGLEDSLQLSSSQYEWLLTAFYITYILFEWMIMLYRIVPAHIYIAACVFSWGVVASFQALVTSFPQMLILRGLLGITEAAFGPGVPFYMTFFYKREELAYRVGLQISAAPLATSFASSLAWVIVKVSEGSKVDGWRALFLVEGFPSVVAAVLAFYWIPDGPSTARWLSGREGRVAVLRLRGEDGKKEGAVMGNAMGRGRGSAAAAAAGGGDTASRLGSHGINTTDLIQTLTDPKSYLTALMFLSVNVSFASLPVFLPTIINSMSFSALTSQILAAPPYLISFAFVLVVGWYSDKIPDSRGLFLFGSATLSCLSYAVIALVGTFHEQIGSEAGSITVRYVAVYGAAMGLFGSVVLIITWTLNNQHSATGKGVGLTILNVVGQCGPLIGVRVFDRATGEPFYVFGMCVCAGFMGVVAVLSLVLRWYLMWLNGRGEKSRGTYEMVGMGKEEHDDGEGEGVEGAEDGLIDVGKLERFRFML